MSKIFISHSSVDNAYALALAEWLDREGWSGQYFLDVKPDEIAPGERWEIALRKAARVCEAVILLISRSWLASSWCQDEMRLARHLGKQLIGVLIDDQVAIDDVPDLIKREWQLCFLTLESDKLNFEVRTATIPATTVSMSSSGLARLKTGLQRAGLTPEAFPWPPENDTGRSPYRGLKPLEAIDAAVFFGRDADLLDAIGQLRSMRESLSELCFVIVGASGAGKSSFLRAGLVPRLKRISQHFLVAPIVRPRRGVIGGPDGLVASLETISRELGMTISRAKIRERLAGKGGLGSLVEDLRHMGTTSEAPPPTIIIPIDQGEELFAHEGAEEAEHFFALFRDEALSEAESTGPARTPFIVVMTIRSDSYSPLQADDALANAQRRLFDLPPISPSLYHTIIEGPARRAREAGSKLEIDPRLALALLRDAANGADALPLLAYTLEELYLEHGGDSVLRLEQYEAQGRIRGVLTQSVNAAFAEPGAEPAIPPDEKTRSDLLRAAFIPHLVDLSEDQQPTRRGARWIEIPEPARPLIERLIRQRLLVRDVREIDGEKVDIVEIAHESLLRHWPALTDWLAEETARIRALGYAARAAGRWNDGGRRDDDLQLQGPRLAEVLALLERSDYGPRLRREGIDQFLFACRHKESRLFEEQRRMVLWRNRAVATAFVVLMVSSIALGYFWRVADQSLLSSGKAWIRRARDDLANGQPYAAYRESGMVLGRGPASTGRRFIPPNTPESVEAETIFEVSSDVVADTTADYKYNTASFSLAVSPDRMRLASGEVGSAVVRELPSGTILATLKGHSSQVTQVSFLGSSDPLVTADVAGKVGFWDLRTRKGVFECLAGPHGNFGLAYSPTSRLVAVGDPGGDIVLWDADKVTSLAGFHGYSQPIRSIAIDPTGTRLVTGGERGEIALWSVDRTGAQSIRLLRKVQGHSGIIFSVAFGMAGREVLTAATDGKVLRWSANDLSSRGSLPQHSSAMWQASYDDSLGAIVTTARDNIIRLFDEYTGKFLMAIDQDSGWVYETAADGGKLFAASNDQRVKRFDAASAFEALRPLPANDDDVLSGAFSKNGKWFAAGGRDVTTLQTVNVWRIDGGKVTHNCAAHIRGTFSQLAFSGDSKTLAVASEVGDGVTLWNSADCTEKKALSLHDGAGFKAIAYAPRGDFIAAAPVDARDGSQVVLFDAHSGQVVARVRGHDAHVWALAFHPSGDYLASGDESGRLVIWRLAEGSGAPQLRMRNTLYGGKFIKALAFSPDGLTLARGADEGEFLLYDFSNMGAKPVRLGTFQGMIDAISYSSDGHLIAAAGDDARLGIWDTRSHTQIYDLAALTGIWGPFGFHPTKPWLAFDGGFGVVRIWDMSAGLRRAAAHDAGAAHDALLSDVAETGGGEGFAITGMPALSCRTH